MLKLDECNYFSSDTFLSPIAYFIKMNLRCNYILKKNK